MKQTKTANYTSEIAIIMGKEDFWELVSNSKDNDIYKSYSLILESTKVQIDNMVVMHFKAAKWNESGNNVKFIMNFLRKDADGFGFIRLGENIDDVESEHKDSDNGGDFYGYAGVVATRWSRSIYGNDFSQVTKRKICVQEGEQIDLLA